MGNPDSPDKQSDTAHVEKALGESLREALDHVISDQPKKTVDLLTNALKVGTENSNLDRIKALVAELAEPSVLRTLQDTFVDGIVVMEKTGTIISANLAVAVMFGFSSATEMLGKCMADLMPERYRAAHRAGLDRLRQGGEPKLVGKVLSLHGLNQQGVEFPLELTVGAQGEGESLFFTSVIRDKRIAPQAL